MKTMRRTASTKTRPVEALDAEETAVGQAVALAMRDGTARTRWSRGRRRWNRPHPDGVSVSPGAPLSVPAPGEVLEAIAQEYGLERAHWGTGGVWGLDRFGRVTYIEAAAGLSGRRPLGGPLAYEGEAGGHGDDGVDGDHVDVGAAKAVRAR